MAWKVPPRYAKIPPSFHQGFTKLPPRPHLVPPAFSKFRGVWLSGAGLPKGSVQRSTKVAPRFHQGFTRAPPSSPSFVVFLVPWQTRLGLPKVPQKVPPRFHQVGQAPPRCSKFRCVSGSLHGHVLGCKRFVLGCQKVLGKVHQGSPTFRQVCRKVAQVSRKGSVEGSPIISLHLPPSSFNSFSHFPPTLALGPSAIVKVSGQNCFRALYGGSLEQAALGQVPPRFQQRRSHQGLSSFVVYVSVGPIGLGLPKGSILIKKVLWKDHQGFTKLWKFR